MSVWLALAHARHPHHDAALAWGESVGPSSQFFFCRVSQLSLLRLLTNSSVMGEDVLTQAEAWRVYDLFLANGMTYFAEEPKGLEARLRERTSAKTSSTKEWADAYLVTFAELGGLRFVTFDKALAAKNKSAILLRG